MPIQLSIIIPTHGPAPYLSGTLRSVAQFAERSELVECIVVQNGLPNENAKNSFLSTISELEKTGRGKFLFVHETESSSLAGRHRGFFESSGDVLAFIDDDVVLDAGWLEAVVDVFRDDSVDVAGGPSRPHLLSSMPEWVEALFEDLPGGGKASPFLSLLELPGEWTRDISPLYIWSLNLVIRREVFERAGGFHPCVVPRDALMFAGDGETGLARALIQLGARAKYVPELSVKHVIPGDRLTWDFIERRSRVEGVALAFRAIRESGGSTKTALFSRRILGQVRHFVGKSAFWLPGDRGRVFREVLLGTLRGWFFLFRHFRADSAVREWINRPNYWDYRVRSSDVVDKSTTAT